MPNDTRLSDGLVKAGLQPRKKVLKYLLFSVAIRIQFAFVY
jgi:hypothetical protein